MKAYRVEKVRKLDPTLGTRLETDPEPVAFPPRALTHLDLSVRFRRSRVEQRYACASRLKGKGLQGTWPLGYFTTIREGVSHYTFPHLCSYLTNKQLHLISLW